MLGRDLMVQDIIDYLSNTSDAMIMSALLERGLIVTRVPEEPSSPDDIRVVGTIKLVSIKGEPISRVKVSVTPIQSNYSITSSTGETFYPCLSDIPVHQYTDANGEASFHLVKGAGINLSTSLSASTREITVPNTDFNLLDPSISNAVDYLSDPVAPRVSVLRSDI